MSGRKRERRLCARPGCVCFSYAPPGAALGAERLWGEIKGGAKNFKKKFENRSCIFWRSVVIYTS